MVCQIKVREKRDKRDKPPGVLDCRSFAGLGGFCREIPTGRFRQAESWSHIWIGGSHSWHLHRLRIYETSSVAFELSKLLNQENALSVPCLKHFPNYCGPIRPATCGFPWEKTTKRPAAFPDFVQSSTRRSLILRNYRCFAYLSKTH